MSALSQDVDAARAFYDRISGVYDCLDDRDEHVARDIGLRLLDVRRGEQVLEIGFGTGRSLVFLAQAVGREGRVCGIDIAEGMRRIAELHLDTAAVADRCDLTVAAIPPIPQPAERFDATFLSFTLELFPAETIPAVLSEIRRTLRSMGRVGVVSMATPTVGERETFMERTYQWMHQHFPHIVDCRPIDLPDVLRTNGFSVDREERLSIWSMPVSICVARPGHSA